MLFRSELPEQHASLPNRPSGGRTWWAHFEITPINIALTIPKNEFEEIRNLRFISAIYWR
jgi:hypothetical protein